MQMNIHNSISARIEGARVREETPDCKAYSTARLIVTGVFFETTIILFSSADKPFVDVPVLFNVNTNEERGVRYALSEIAVYDVESIKCETVHYGGNKWFDICITRTQGEDYRFGIFMASGKDSLVPDFAVIEGELMPKAEAAA